MIRRLTLLVLPVLALALGLMAASPSAALANTPPSCGEDPPVKRVDNDAFVSYAPSCFDPDNDALTFAVVGQPAHGDIARSDYGGTAHWTYTPYADYVGPDAFKIEASDGTSESAGQTVRFDVTDPSPPTCTNPVARTMRPDTVLGVSLNYMSPGTPGYCEGSPGAGYSFHPFTFRITQQPEHGTLGGSIGSGYVEYRPSAGHSGTDSFKYVVANSGGDSQELTQQITIDPAYNRAPSCYAGGQQPVLRVGTTKVLGISCFDPDGDPLTVSYDRADTRGTVVEDVEPDGPYMPGTRFVRYTAPATAGDGTDSFSFTATDDRGAASGAPAVQHVTVHAAGYNDVPVCGPGFGMYGAAVVKGNSINISSNCSDADEDPFTLEITSPPAHGTVKVVTNTFGGVTHQSFLYKAPADFVGDDPFSYRATDDHGGTSAINTGTVRVAEPTPPGCVDNGPIQMRTNGRRSFQLNCWNTMGPGLAFNSEPVTFTISKQPQHGTIDFSGGATSGRGVYTPDEDYEGPDSFAFKAANSAGSSSESTQSIQVAPGYNQAPYCWGSFGFGKGEQVRGDGARDLAVTCFDPDEDPLDVTFTDPPHGTVGAFEPASGDSPVGTGTVRYTPDPGYRGGDSFSFKASDGLAESNDATELVNVVDPAVNHSPDCYAGTGVRVAANSSHGFGVRDLPCWDRDADELAIEITDAPDHGTLSAPDAGGTRTYTPSDPTYTGEDSFTVQASDGRGGSASAPVDIEVTPAAEVTAVAPPLPSGEPVDLQNYVDGDGRSLITVPRPEVNRFPGGCMPLDVTTSISAGSDGGTVSDVRLVLVQGSDDTGERVPMTHGDGDHWNAHVDCVGPGDLAVEWTLTEAGTPQELSKPLGGIVLIDPQGVVYDKDAYDAALTHGKTAAQARAAAALEGATVVLQRRTAGVWSKVSSGDPGVSPNVNPQVTHADGLFRWDVAAGTYRVVVTRPGYLDVTSAAVSIPPAVTDLHVGMTKAPAGDEEPDPGTGTGTGTGGGNDEGSGTGSDPPGSGPSGDGPPSDPGPVVTPPPPQPKPACSGLVGKKRAACLSRQRLKRALAKCSKLKGKKQRATCAKRARARAKCDRLSGRKKKTCVRRANAIGARRR